MWSRIHLRWVLVFSLNNFWVANGCRSGATISESGNWIRIFDNISCIISRQAKGSKVLLVLDIFQFDLIVTSSVIDKKLEIDKKNLEIKLEIYKNLEIKLEIYKISRK